jgi:galactose-1-phosphate uridylyltransferase
MINQAIASLVQYAIDKGLMEEDDRVYAVNTLLERMKLDSFEAPEALLDRPVDQLLDILTDDAVSRGLCEDDPVCRDIFDTGLMGCLTPRPSVTRDRPPVLDAPNAQAPEATRSIAAHRRICAVSQLAPSVVPLALPTLPQIQTHCYYIKLLRDGRLR